MNLCYFKKVSDKDFPILIQCKSKSIQHRKHLLLIDWSVTNEKGQPSMANFYWLGSWDYYWCGLLRKSAFGASITADWEYIPKIN